jgi:nucleoside diphosphate kinase
MEQTLAIIKSDVVGRQWVGMIISKIEMNELAVHAIRTMRVAADQSALF